MSDLFKFIATLWLTIKVISPIVIIGFIVMITEDIICRRKDVTHADTIQRVRTHKK